MSFINKVILVTGASSGIGKSIAVHFAKEGAILAIAGRNEENLRATAEQCRKGKHLVIKADLTNDEETKDIITKTIHKYGTIDVLINNAGLISPGTIMDGRLLEAFDNVVRVNLRSAVHLTALAAPYLIKSKGNIINISSICGIKSDLHKELLPYAVTKAGVDHFMRGAAGELGPYGVRVNNINPGPVRTNIFQVNFDVPMDYDTLSQDTALGKCCSPDEIAEMCLYIASEKAKSVTGSYFIIDNGLMVKY